MYQKMLASVGCTYNGQECTFPLIAVVNWYVLASMMARWIGLIVSVACNANSSSAITAGREVHGQPQKFGFPNLVCERLGYLETLYLTNALDLKSVDKDTLFGETKYGQQEIATGSMAYKHHRLELSEAYKFFEKPEINLKIIPSVTGKHPSLSLYLSLACVMSPFLPFSC